MSVKINYNGAQIAAMTESGAKTLKTGGTFVPYDISVEYDGGGSAATNGVFFLDYDGRVVTSWDASTVSGKTALPENPTHTRLVAQGWNWTLDSIQSYITKYPGANVFVGQMYKTASGLTEMDITVTKVTGLTVTCKMAGNKTWGDGTTDSATSHTYADYGNYTITCSGTTIPAGSSTSCMFGTSDAICTAIRIGSSVTSIGGNAFIGCHSLTSITIPDSVTSIGNYAFKNCYSLTSITMPDGVTSIGNYAFQNCYSLTSITIPDSVTSIRDSVFLSCNSLTSITIPDSVTSIGGYVFNGCHSLTSITIPYGVTSIGGNAFSSCYSLTSITIPYGVTSIGDYVFNGCHSLTSITLPNSVTTIPQREFYNCSSLTSITLPDSVTSISNNVFYNCYSLIEYDFSAATAVPTLENTNAFSGINPICKIKVPASLYDQWIAATNWTTYADYIVAV